MAAVESQPPSPGTPVESPPLSPSPRIPAPHPPNHQELPDTDIDRVGYVYHCANCFYSNDHATQIVSSNLFSGQPIPILMANVDGRLGRESTRMLIPVTYLANIEQVNVGVRPYNDWMNLRRLRCIHCGSIIGVGIVTVATGHMRPYLDKSTVYM